MEPHDVKNKVAQKPRTEIFENLDFFQKRGKIDLFAQNEMCGLGSFLGVKRRGKEKKKSNSPKKNRC